MSCEIIASKRSCRDEHQRRSRHQLCEERQDNPPMDPFRQTDGRTNGQTDLLMLLHLQIVTDSEDREILWKPQEVLQIHLFFFRIPETRKTTDHAEERKEKKTHIHQSIKPMHPSNKSIHHPEGKTPTKPNDHKRWTEEGLTGLLVRTRSTFPFSTAARSVRRRDSTCSGL